MTTEFLPTNNAIYNDSTKGIYYLINANSPILKKRKQIVYEKAPEPIVKEPKVFKPKTIEELFDDFQTSLNSLYISTAQNPSYSRICLIKKLFDKEIKPMYNLFFEKSLEDFDKNFSYAQFWYGIKNVYNHDFKEFEFRTLANSTNRKNLATLFCQGASTICKNFTNDKTTKLFAGQFNAEIEKLQTSEQRNELAKLSNQAKEQAEKIEKAKRQIALKNELEKGISQEKKSEGLVGLVA